MKPRALQHQPADLSLESPLPYDRTLPRPPGALQRRRNASAREIADTTRKLEATRQFGGLLPERIHQPHWACIDCGRIYDNRDDAYFCHKTGASRVQICPRCNRRLCECSCPPLSRPSPTK